DKNIQKIAKENYVGTCRDDKLKSEARQEEIANWFKSMGLKAESIPDQKPFDILVHGKALIEFKLKVRGHKDEVNHHKDALGRKMQDAKQKGLKIFTAVFDERQGEDNRKVYICQDICWGLSSMKQAASPKDFVKYVMKNGGRV